MLPWCSSAPDGDMAMERTDEGEPSSYYSGRRTPGFSDLHPNLHTYFYFRMGNLSDVVFYIEHPGKQVTK